MPRSITLSGIMLAALLAGCGSSQNAAAPEDNRVIIAVTDEGYEPSSVTVAAGKPVTLVVTRSSSKTCATEIVLPEYNINQPLPLGEPVEITFTPTQAGELTYACAMDMYKGKIVVK